MNINEVWKHKFVPFYVVGEYIDFSCARSPVIYSVQKRRVTHVQQLVPGRREHKCPTCTTCDCCTSFRQRHVVPAWHSIRRILEPSIAFHDKCFDHVSHPASVTQHTMAGLKDVHRQNKQHEQIVSYVFDYIDNNNNTTTTNKNNNSVTRDVTATITVAATS